MEIKGTLAASSLSGSEKDIFADYLQHTLNNPVIEFVKYLLGDDYLRFIDILSGTTFKIPSARSLEKDVEAVKIFAYVQKYGFTEESVKVASKMFGKTVLITRRYAYRVAKALGVEDTLEGDSLINFILYIKSVEEPPDPDLIVGQDKSMVSQDKTASNNNSDNTESEDT